MFLLLRESRFFLTRDESATGPIYVTVEPIPGVGCHAEFA